MVPNVIGAGDWLRDDTKRLVFKHFSELVYYGAPVFIVVEGSHTVRMNALSFTSLNMCSVIHSLATFFPSSSHPLLPDWCGPSGCPSVSHPPCGGQLLVHGSIHLASLNFCQIPCAPGVTTTTRRWNFIVERNSLPATRSTARTIYEPQLLFEKHHCIFSAISLLEAGCPPLSNHPMIH